jgi:phenylacetate-CoA ligase
MIILRGVNVFPTQIEEIVLRVPGLAPHFQLLRTREARMDRLTVLAEALPAASTSDRAAASSLIIATVKDMVGVTVAVEIVEPGSLERSAGKMQRVIDRREMA